MAETPKDKPTALPASPVRVWTPTAEAILLLNKAADMLAGDAGFFGGPDDPRYVAHMGLAEKCRETAKALQSV